MATTTHLRKRHRSPRPVRVFIAWLPAIIGVCCIIGESTEAFSARNTSSWLRPIVQRLFGVMADSTWETIHHLLRKTGHFTGYGTVCFTFLRAWLHTLDRRGRMTLLAWRLQSSILAIFSTAIVASCDEFHQSFLPDRTGTPQDVLLDMIGACILQLLFWAVMFVVGKVRHRPDLETV